MSQVIVITSGKGGVGKTTSTANIGTGLARLGYKVVLIDTDIGLRNLDVVMGLENRIVYNLVDVIEGTCRIRQALIRDRRYPTLYLMPSAQTRDKSAVSPQQMKKLVNELREEFDYILLDCPPSLSLIPINALCACDTVLVPMTCEYFAMEGLSQLVESIRLVKQRYNPTIDIEGILFTMFDGRLNLTTQVVSEVKKHFPKKPLSKSITFQTVLSPM